MIKRIVLLVLLIILSLSAPALAAESSTGKVEGRIINGTADGSSVADQNVTLKTYLNDAEVSTANTKTDAEGQFTFEGLSAEPGYGYQVTLIYQGADYYGEWLTFDGEATTEFIEVTVYNSTTSEEVIEVATAHTIIYIGEGSLQVKEYLLFINETDHTYIGPDKAGNSGTLTMSLPEGAHELQYTLGLMECCIIGSENSFAETMPVLPGSKEVAYSYKVSYNSNAYTYSQGVNYPIANFDLLVQDEGVAVTGERLTTGETIDIGGARFNHLSGKDFARGDTIVFQLSGLPETGNQGTIQWVVLVLIVLVSGFGLVYVLRKRGLKPISSEDGLDQRKRRLFVELAQLDDDYECGRIPEDEYYRLRTERKAQLVDIIRRSEE